MFFCFVTYSQYLSNIFYSYKVIFYLFICIMDFPLSLHLFLKKIIIVAKNVQKDITYLESGGIKDRLCLRLSNDENKASSRHTA